MKKVIVLSVVIGLWVLNVARAQDSVSVPDVTGKTPPQAAAALNAVGLLLGTQTPAPCLPGPGCTPDAITTQTPAAGSGAAPGSVVDVTVQRAPNVTLQYDDNDLTVINRAGADIPLGALVFAAQQGTAAQFGATRWGLGVLGANDCMQVWSISRRNPKDIEGCRSMQWLTTNNTGEHFWTQLNGVSSFTVTQDGVQRAVCPAAAAGTQPIVCDLYLPISGAGDGTPYLYFAYTIDTLVILNNSADRWMALAGVLLNGGDLGAPGTFTSSAFFDANNKLLAPGQCVQFGAGSPPQPCQVVARGLLLFWTQAFAFTTTTDDSSRRCPAALPGRLTLCIMPR